LDEVEGAASIDALKTRSLPAFLRPKPRPLSTEDDLHQLYAKVNLSKKYKNRMRSEHAAIIALSKSQSQFFDADAVIVYDQRTAL
ncbi:jg23690, partial [Pararge aegeria aegeria]